MTRTSHRAPRHRLSRWLLPGAVTVTAWLADNTPGSAAGLAAFAVLGLLVSVFYPLLLLIALEAPGALVPSRCRIWYRRGAEGRPHIPDRLRRLVYAADRHACCYCGSSAGLQLDHFRPWSRGGRTSFWNFLTLCGYHNRVKSNYWEDRGGYVHYRAFDGYDRPNLARSILAFERRRRRSIMRLVRAALAL